MKDESHYHIPSIEWQLFYPRGGAGCVTADRVFLEYPENGSLGATDKYALR